MANQHTIEAQYTTHKLDLPPDYEGEVTATLLAYPPSGHESTACLYLHGYTDYFFQDHLRAWYTERGIAFFALDLRKHGRSLLPHQRPCYVHDLHEYFPEIDLAIEIMKAKYGFQAFFLNGHSTGGLISTLYAHTGRYRDRIRGLILNSPFLAFRPVRLEKRIIRAYSFLSRFFPGITVSSPPKGVYGHTLHRDYEGEWDYDLDKKPVLGFPLYGAWLRAISRAHRTVQAGLDLACPILILCSDKSYLPEQVEPEAFRADIVLDVASMRRFGPGLGQSVTMAVIPDAMHDVFLSRAPVRAQAFRAMEKWIDHLNESGHEDHQGQA